LPKIRTDLDHFSDLEVCALVWHGYCVAQDTCGATSAAGTTFTPWNPLPKSQDKWAKALIANASAATHQRSIPDVDKLRKKLDDAARRRLRAMSFKDPASYAHVGMILLLCMVVYFWSDVKDTTLAALEGKRISSRVGELTDALSVRYAEDLKNKRYQFNNRVVGYVTHKKNPSYPVETWTTSQAAYAELKNPNLKAPDVQNIVQAINERFVACPEGAGEGCHSKDFHPQVNGWYTRPSTKVFDAHPALWTLGALALLVNNPHVDKSAKAELKEKIADIQGYLNKQQFYDPESGGWHMFAAQAEKKWFCPYTTNLALLVMLDVRDAGLTWAGNQGGDSLNQMINSSAGWLIEKYSDIPGSQGWLGIGDLNDTKVSDAFTFHTFAVLLESEMRAGVKIPEELKKKIPGRLLSLKTRSIDNSMGSVLAKGMGVDGIREYEGSITFLSRPWVIRVARLYVKKLREENAGQRIIFRYEDLVRSLLVSEQALFDRTSEDFTFVSSEMLIGLSPLP
jgi:hypothetical protein